MMLKKATVVICGAGAVGISAAYHLTQLGVQGVVLVEKGEPMGLTSLRGTEAYRNWWPGPGEAMVKFMNRSLDLLDEAADQNGNYFEMSRRGYVYLTGEQDKVAPMKAEAAAIAALGAGDFAEQTADSYAPSPTTGYAAPRRADVVTDPAVIRQHYPFITPDALAFTHVRRAGWLSSAKMGEWFLAQAQAGGAQLVRDEVVGVVREGQRVTAVQLASGQTLETEVFLVCAGPLLPRIGQLLGVTFPVYNELHGKITVPDPEGVVPESAPLMIWEDATPLVWTAAEREQLAADPQRRFLLDVQPPGVHFRPRPYRGQHALIAIWMYQTVHHDPPLWPLLFEPSYAEIVLRALGRLIPDIAVYFGRGHGLLVDGGYYCRTPEYRPLIGPLDALAGVYVAGGMGGFGLMGAPAAGELVARHITGEALPDYAEAFRLGRYDDPAYLQQFANRDGQL